jgi:Dullard-like phosphatase family protein
MSNENEFLLPPKTNDKIDKKTLVLDLDETLLHSQRNPFSSSQSDIVLKLELESDPYDIHVLIRPGAKEFIRKMNKFFEIVIFTASVSKYALPLINLIDDKNLCLHKLYREHCSLVNTSFIKDLKKLGRDLKDIIIIDNTPLAYSLNKENGIPIVSWFEDKRDRELYNLIPILEFLSSVPDVREFIPKLVINNEISYFASMDIIRKYKSSTTKKVVQYNTSVSGNIKSVDTLKKEEKINTDKKEEKQNTNTNNDMKLVEKNNNENKKIETNKKIIEKNEDGKDETKKEKEKETDIINEDDIDIDTDTDINLADLLGNNDDNA